MTDRELMQMALDALECSKEAIEEWGSYASPYFQAKHNLEGDIDDCQAVIEALRARLEKWTADDTAYRPGGLPQEEQELVAWSRVNMNDHKEGDLGIGTVKWDASAPLVVHPHPAFQATQPQPSEAEVCCQDFEKCVRSCTPRGQWIAHVRCACGDQIMPNDGAECGNCVTARNAVKQEPLAQMKEMLEVQGRDGTWNYDPYLQGMFNGMEFMVALAEGREPVFREPPERWLHTPPQREWQGLTDEELREFEIWLDDEEEKHGWNPPADIVKYIEAKLKEKNT